MWELYLEWCAEIFGVAVRSKLGQLVLFSLFLFGVGLFFSMRWGLGAWAVPAVIVVASSLAARRVATARNEVWRAAFGALDGPPAPMGRRGAIAPTVASLLGLADAVRAARRGLFDDANTLLVHIDRERLRPEEIDLLDTVLRKGSRSAALEPDGDEPPDTAIGRATVAHAWSDPDKLAAIERALDRAGVEAGPLARLRGLVRIRQGGQRIEALRPPEARELSDEARAMGDEELASELDARARPTAYR